VPTPNPKPGPPGVTTQDTAALTGTPPAPVKATPDKRQRIVVSQGTYDDLARLRKVTDPGSGYELRVGDDGAVTAFDRGTDKPADVDVVCPRVPPVKETP